MKIEFLEPAKTEFAEAVLYYNDQSEGLGYEFAAEVKRTIERIVQYPEAWTELSKLTRRCRTSRFPYGLIYQIHENSILIVAVMHLSKNPVTWKKRLIK
jgi:plasmid stabilization system protein ParE